MPVVGILLACLSLYGYQGRYQKLCWLPSPSPRLFIIWIWCCSHKDAGAFMRSWRWCSAGCAPSRRALSRPPTSAPPALRLTLRLYRRAGERTVCLCAERKSQPCVCRAAQVQHLQMIQNKTFKCNREGFAPHFIDNTKLNTRPPSFFFFFQRLRTDTGDSHLSL